MAILKKYHRPTGSRNLHPYIFRNKHFYRCRKDLRVNLLCRIWWVVHWNYICIFYPKPFKKINAFTKRELCTLFPSRTERPLEIQIFVAPHSLNDGWTISMPRRHNTASYDTYLHKKRPNKLEGLVMSRF